MDGLRSIIVLGAGASRCYEDGRGTMPLQADIAERMWFDARITVGTGQGFPTTVGPAGLIHAFDLAEFLKARFGLGDDGPRGKLAFWQELQARGLGLEALYREIEQDPSDRRSLLLQQFEALVRTAVVDPVGPRRLSNVCRYHKRIAEALEPGDLVVTFNWDSLMADAMLHFTPFWFPATGFGIPVSVFRLWGQKSFGIDSAVLILQMHGSVLLYEDDASSQLMYVGPVGYSHIDLLRQIGRSTPGAQEGEGSVTWAQTPESQAAANRSGLGHIVVQGRWFSPVFVPPSSLKAEYSTPYAKVLKQVLHSQLPFADQIVFAGYSLPETDLPHLSRLFPESVIRPDARIRVINPQNEDENFKARLLTVLSRSACDFDCKDFRSFCLALAVSPAGYPPSAAAAKVIS